ncbi:hypothetical protein JFL43_20940 [Viridibacillus sp. YIM B01967]|uniref:Uncharacterized protein n=1 Tax=Viridibacillus soli TaxID=2798301 RepID=A0ABS1HDS9_9BACL|nr:hypothetical protein [Viridibacillus soli]MBK3497247.1 hypothetical protein [Viridibacillus soli]
MERIKQNFNLLLQGDESPYHQVTEDRRISIVFEAFKGEPSFVRNLVSLLFKEDSKIDVSFFNYYFSRGVKGPFYFNKQRLNKAIKIKNWKEYEYVDLEDGYKSVYTNIKNLKIVEVIRYFMTIVNGNPTALIAFYNDDYLLTIDGDEVVIIAKTSVLMERFREAIHCVNNKSME